jgi:GNAT superfamily N-acetyltransferase
MSKSSIRKGVKTDLPRVLELVKELAEYEKASHEVTNTLVRMEADGFGEKPIFGFFVAQSKEGIVGLSLYYYRYSTWKGKRLYLEDIIVTEKERGHGLGKLLFDRTMQQCIEDGCTGMMWQVLNWNDPAINFYKKYYDAKLDYEWVNCQLESETIKELLADNNK